jgi:poly(3-hydroxybutyrate) depolymerase
MLMRKLCTFLIALLTFSAASAQTPCSTGRYASDVYTAITTTSNITYGSNTSWNGANTTLKMDFYEPTADTATKRPLLIWVHGGSFIGGSKTDIDMVDFAEGFARKGYACASIDYRLGFFPFDSANAVKAVVRATQDLKAAIRFFYKDRQLSNTYKIDTNNIFIGGSSAGAITALHVAYLDNECEIADYLTAAQITSLGGLEGNSGNPGYSTTVQGVINGCGALARYSWLEAGDVPLCSIHGTNDGTVKYNRGIVNPGTPLMYLDGSRMLHERACAVNLENQFYTFNNAPHVPYAGTSAAQVAYMDTTMNFIRDFLVKELGCTDGMLQPENPMAQAANLYPIDYCDGSPVSDVCLSATNPEQFHNKMKVYPNPASDKLTVVWEYEGEMTIELFDYSGRNIGHYSVNGDHIELKRNGLKSGSYLLIISTENGQRSTERIIFN